MVHVAVLSAAKGDPATLLFRQVVYMHAVGVFCSPNRQLNTLSGYPPPN
ncbi:uncharacterized protein METZ01_LOCUS298534, partial [marine metagenome]